jgi:hypothetical protein
MFSWTRPQKCLTLAWARRHLYSINFRKKRTKFQKGAKTMTWNSERQKGRAEECWGVIYVSKNREMSSFETWSRSREEIEGVFVYAEDESKWLLTRQCGSHFVRNIRIWKCQAPISQPPLQPAHRNLSWSLPTRPTYRFSFRPRPLPHGFQFGSTSLRIF